MKMMRSYKTEGHYLRSMAFLGAMRRAEAEQEEHYGDLFEELRQGGSVSTTSHYDSPKDIPIKETYLEGLARQYGRLYVTPRGVYSVLKQIEEDYGMYRKTILQRFYSSRKNLTDWYIIEDSAPLRPAETCKYCEVLEEKLFKKGLWLCSVNHQHDSPISDDTIVTFVEKGKERSLTLLGLKRKRCLTGS